MITSAQRRDTILEEAIRVFGRYGYRKTSVEDLARAAGLSKPGLYLHFTSKEEIFRAAMQKYLADALLRVEEALGAPGTPLPLRLADAVQTWFGRHLLVFATDTIATIEAGDRLSELGSATAADAFRTAVANAFFEEGFDRKQADDRAQVIFLSGLSWKQPGMTPESFAAAMTTVIDVCCSQKPNRKN